MKVGDRVVEKVITDLKKEGVKPWVGTVTASLKNGDMYEIDYGADKPFLFRFMWSVKQNFDIVE